MMIVDTACGHSSQTEFYGRYQHLQEERRAAHSSHSQYSDKLWSSKASTSRGEGTNQDAVHRLLAGIMGEKLNDIKENESHLESRRSIGSIGMSSLDNCRRIAFNVSGKRFETYEGTVAKFPDCLLALPQRELFYDPLKKEYFFDRNRKAFGAILTYCQTGVLVKPTNLDDRIFAAELRYFGFEDEADAHLPPAPMESDRDLPENKYKRKVWELFEYPDTSIYARLIALFSVTVILLSIVMFCVETLPRFKETVYSLQRDANGTVISKTEKGERTKPRYAPTFFGIECFCIAWFTIEYISRLLSSPRKLKFLYQALNIIDLVAILPFYITWILDSTDTNVSSLSILRVLRLVRVFRIFKLSRYSKGLKILGYTFKASLQELGLLAFFLLIGIVLFSSAAYYCESSVKGTKFESIPHSFWWAIVTMTTVGYGDMYPETLGGKLVGSFCVLLGVLAIAFPVPVIVNNFTYYYTMEQSEPEPLDDDYLDMPLGRRKKSSTVSNRSNTSDTDERLPTIVIDKINGKTHNNPKEPNGNDDEIPLSLQVESNV